MKHWIDAGIVYRISDKIYGNWEDFTEVEFCIAHNNEWHKMNAVFDGSMNFVEFDYEGYAVDPDHIYGVIGLTDALKNSAMEYVLPS